VKSRRLSLKLQPGSGLPGGPGTIQIEYLPRIDAGNRTGRPVSVEPTPWTAGRYL